MSVISYRQQQCLFPQTIRVAFDPVVFKCSRRIIQCIF